MGNTHIPVADDTVVTFLCRLQSIAAHRDHFVRRLSLRPSVCLVVTLSW